MSRNNGEFHYKTYEAKRIKVPRILSYNEIDYYNYDDLSSYELYILNKTSDNKIRKRPNKQNYREDNDIQ